MTNRSFFFKVGIYSSPFLLVVGWFFVENPYRIGPFKPGLYDDPILYLNREMVCYETHNALKDSVRYDAFIFGSSRSQAYHCDDWAQHLPADAVPFHFDASAESITGTWQKIRYLHRAGTQIRHALLIVDPSFFNTMNWNRPSPAFHTHPLGSGQLTWRYCFAYLRAFLTPDVLMSYFDYQLFGVYRPYMKWFANRPDYNAYLDPVTCDLHYGMEDQIRSDSLTFYSSRRWERPEKERQNEAVPSEQEMALVSEIARVFEEHGTQVQVIVSPLFDRVRLSEARLALLQRHFGVDRVHDFSGDNEWTAPIGNYYEANHYRPHVARALMHEVYGTSSVLRGTPAAD